MDQRQLPEVGCPYSFIHHLEQGFTEGFSLIISYKLPADFDWFSVNLMTGEEDIYICSDTEVAFHFNPRIYEDAIVRNSLLEDVWGREERDGEQPFRPGDSGEIQIVCLKDSYKVLAPGVCTLYKHRTDCRRVSHLGILGDVKVTQISYNTGQVNGAAAAASSVKNIAIPRHKPFSDGGKPSQRLQPAEDISEELQCPICLEMFRRATTLDCGHTFCADCLQEVCAINGGKCSVCRAHISSAAHSVALDNIIRSMTAKQ